MNGFGRIAGGTTGHSAWLSRDDNQAAGYNPLMWFMALLLATFLAGCTGSDKSSVDLASVVSVAVTPATSTIPIGITQQFTATATYSDGLTHDVTAAPGIVWTSADTAVATISAAGIATGVASGTSVITAAIGGQSATATLTVNVAVLQSIAVTPAAPSIPISTTQQFTAMATYDIGPVIDVTTSATWTSGTPGVATIVPATGLATAVASGSSVIMATFGGQSGMATLTVNAAVLQSIAVTPAPALVAMGLTQQFTAMATYDVGPVIDVTASPGMVWSSGTPGVATIAPASGLATTVSPGTSVITAVFGGQTSPAATLTVTAATLSSITVTPAAPSIVVAGTQQFVATATYSDLTISDVTADPSTVWSSSVPAIATIVSTTGVATGVAVGTSDITAVFGGQTSPAATLTVTAAPLTVLPGAGSNPTVASASPANLDTNVPISTEGVGNAVTGKQLVATFNEAMNPATINAAVATTSSSTFSLRETVSGNNVPGTVAMNTANTVATFTPNVTALTANTDYTATVSTAALTAGAAPLSATVEWSFRTKAGAQTFSQLPLYLGKVGTFAIFSNTAVTSVPTSNVKGNIGTAGTGSNTTISCPEVTPLNVSKVFTVDATFADATCNTIDGTFVGGAALDLSNAITDAKGRTFPDSVDNQTGVAGNISGSTLAPGLYKWNTGVLIDNTGITITGGANDVWIFQISGDLTVQDNAIITLGGNAQAKNIFWQVGGVTGGSIGSAVAFKGIILADAGITLTAGSTVLGRLFASPAVTLITNTITPPAP